MKKIIKIGNNEYSMKSSAYTQFAYKDMTGRSLLSDLQRLIELQSKKEISLEDIDPVNELLLKIAFVMIQEADDKQVTDYQSFLKNIDSLYESIEWISDVITLATNPISGQLQKN